MTLPALTVGRVMVLIALVLTLILCVAGRLEFLWLGAVLLLVEIGVLVG